ncbi:DUF3173 family protein [Streptococcus pneumoniae]
MKTVRHQNLMDIGFPEHTARDIIKQAKAIAVQEFKDARAFSDNMIQLNKSPFENVRLDLAPRYIVEKLLGFELLSTREEQENE